MSEREASEADALDFPAVRIVLRGRRVGLPAFVLMLACFGPAWLATDYETTSAWSLPLLLVGMVVGIFSAIVSLSAFISPRIERGQLRVDAAGLHWKGTRLFQADSSNEHVAYVNGKAQGVRVSSRSRREYFQLLGTGNVSEFIARLRQNGDVGRATFVTTLFTSYPFLLLPSALLPDVLNACLNGHAHGRPPLIELGALILYALLALLFRSRWQVGTDGVLVERPLRQSVFVSYGALSDVRVAERVVTMTAKGGKTFAIAVADDSRARRIPLVGARALAARIEECRARVKPRADPSHLAPTLGRGGRDVASWLDAIVASVEEPATFRKAPPLRAHLWETLEDASQPAELRVAAATALRSGARESENARLRAVANGTVQPRLRVALEVAATKESDEAELERALALVLADEPRRQRVPGRRG